MSSSFLALRPRTFVFLAAAFATPFAFAIGCGSGSSSDDGDTVSAGQGGSSTAGKAGSATAGTGTAGTGTAGTGTAGTGTAGTGTAGTGTAGTGTAGTGTAGTGTAGTGTAGTAGTGTAGTATAGTAGTSAAGAGGSTAGSGGASAGAAGAGGAPWPDCSMKMPSITKTIPEVWTLDPKTSTPVWIDSVVITAISFGACSGTGTFQCQLFLQTKPTYATFDEGKHQGIKVWVSDKAAVHFTGLVPGDVVDVFGEAIRYTAFGNDELRLHVDDKHPGCMKKSGTATPTPIANVKLTDLTIDAYGHTHGPLLVKVDALKGKPTADPTEIFAVYDAAQMMFMDAGVPEVQTLTPYYLPGGAFQGLLADTWTSFTSVTGVYATFVRTEMGTPVTYRTLGPRTQADLAK